MNGKSKPFHIVSNIGLTRALTICVTESHLCILSFTQTRLTFRIPGLNFGVPRLHLAKFALWYGFANLLNLSHLQLTLSRFTFFTDRSTLLDLGNVLGYIGDFAIVISQVGGNGSYFFGCF